MIVCLRDCPLLETTLQFYRNYIRGPADSLIFGIHWAFIRQGFLVQLDKDYTTELLNSDSFKNDGLLVKYKDNLLNFNAQYTIQEASIQVQIQEINTNEPLLLDIPFGEYLNDSGQLQNLPALEKYIYNRMRDFKKTCHFQSI